MSEKIKKITKLATTESFIQVNFEKGYKYIDKAGQLVNDFYIDDKEPTFNMGLDGLILHQDADVFKEVKITPKGLWAQYSSPDSLDSISNHFSSMLKRVSATISAENFSRVGWRTYFVKEFTTEEARDNALQKFSIDDSMEFKTGVYQGKIEGFSLNLFIKKVATEIDDSNRGILIDVDIYKKFEEYETITNVDNKIKDILNVYKSQSILDLVNKVITG